MEINMTGPIEEGKPIFDKQNQQKHYQHQEKKNSFLNQFNQTLLEQDSLELIISRYMSTPCNGKIKLSEDNKIYNKIIYNFMNKL